MKMQDSIENKLNLLNALNFMTINPFINYSGFA